MSRYVLPNIKFQYIHILHIIPTTFFPSQSLTKEAALNPAAAILYRVAMPRPVCLRPTDKPSKVSNSCLAASLRERVCVRERERQREKEVEAEKE